MAPTWREERPEAITAASHSDVRPSKSMVTIFSALSSSSEVRMRLSKSLGGFFAATGAAAFLAAGFLAAVLRAAALPATDLPAVGDFLTGFADFLDGAGPFLAAFAAFLPAGFLG